MYFSSRHCSALRPNQLVFPDPPVWGPKHRHGPAHSRIHAHTRANEKPSNKRKMLPFHRRYTSEWKTMKKHECWQRNKRVKRDIDKLVVICINHWQSHKSFGEVTFSGKTYMRHACLLPGIMGLYITSEKLKLKADFHVIHLCIRQSTSSSGPVPNVSSILIPKVGSTSGKQTIHR